MLRQLARDTTLYGLANCAARGVQLVLVPIYTRAFEPQLYGVFELLVIVAGLANILIAFEIAQGLGRYIGDQPDLVQKKLYASTAFWFCCVMFGIFIACSVPAAALWARLVLGSENWASLFAVAAFAIAANGVYALLQEVLRWQHRPALYLATSLLYTVTSAVLSVWLAVSLSWGLQGIFYGQLMGCLVAGVVSWSFARHLYRFSVSWVAARRMLSFSAPLVVSSLAVVLWLSLDRIAIRHLLTLHDLGVYGVAYRFALVVSLLTIAVQSALTPLVLKHHREATTKLHLASLVRYFLFGAGIAIVLLTVFSTDIVHTLATEDYEEGAGVVGLIAFALVAFNMNIFAPGLFLANRTGLVAAVNTAGALSNALLCYWLIPQLGIMGAGLSIAASGLLVGVVHVSLGQRHYAIPHEWKRLVIAAGLLLAVVLLTPSAVPAVGGLSLTLKFLTTALLSIFLGFALLGADEIRRGMAKAAVFTSR